MGSTFEDIHANPEISLEEDIVDQLCIVDLNDDIPVRPSSRLGFNYDEDNDPPLTEEGSFERVHHELSYQVCTSTIHLDEHESDITTFMPERAPKLPTRPRSPRVVEDWKLHHDVQSMPDNEDLDFHAESDLLLGEEYSDEDGCPTSLSHMTPSPLDELVCSFSQPPEESDWSLSPKFSCLPSPLSPRYIPFNAVSYRHTPQRHRYHHHGHSRHALLHLKWFWASRQDTWLEHKARIFEAKAYDGFSIFSSMSPRLRLSGGCIPPDPADTPQPPPPPPMERLPPLSIHPRRGDIKALHDPYCMHIDRYFVGMSLWTMSKTLWMFDVHLASGELQPGQHDVEDDLFEDRSESESMETSESRAFSDDSDSTLVESDNEADHPRRTEHANREKAESKGYQVSEHEADSSSSNMPVTADLKRSIFPQPTSMSPKFLCSPPWPANWYRRWEILLQLCVVNNPKTSQPNIPSKSRRFFIGDDWDDVFGEDETANEDQEDQMPKKNVLVVVNDEYSNGQHLRHWF
ncbi:hypothetical protein C0989_000571 [Termitomyces sp. Mn162]|nr:hypothetical protein C0989_000571 [Termitomyces sp. Mn162]KAH0578269.1 hypothetical protein H2248_003893 [Termitomyces sp. 'cryptogamus']